MADCMTFPDTVEEFMEQYKITDTEHIYTNGTELVPIFRMKQWFDHKPEPHSGRRVYQAGYADGFEAGRKAGAHWIPCSERLPEDGTNCLVSVRCSKKVVVVDTATYSTDLFKVDKEDFFGNRGESGWYYLDREYGYCKVLNVIAWMPLPEPYKEDEGC